MTEAEQALMLLCCRVDRNRLPLTHSQYRALFRKLDALGVPPTPEGLADAGLADGERERVAGLLSGKALLAERLKKWERQGIRAVTRLNPEYPQRMLSALGDDAPPALFLLGNAEVLNRPAIAVVGSRKLREENRAFAEKIGRMAAERGLVLVSGDARGADRAAQEACLAAGGSVLSFVSDRLDSRNACENILYASEDGPDYHFSTLRALSRNRFIHSEGLAVFVAQTSDGTGGTWNGTKKNLKYRWSPVYVYEDGSCAAVHLIEEGAMPFSRWEGCTGKEVSPCAEL